jgi:hypothetical protein
MRRLALGIALLLTLAGLTVGVAPAQAAGGHVLVPYGGTAHKLLYGEFPTPTAKHRKPTGTLFWRTAHGKAHRIGSARFGSPVWLTWPMVIYRSPDGYVWRNLRTGAHGHAPRYPQVPAPTADYGTTAEIVAATPNGWLLDLEPREYDPAEIPDWLYLQGTDGTLTSLGTPFTQPGFFQVATTGTTAVITNYGLDDHDYTGFNDGGALAMDFSTPGTFRRILPTQVGADTFCPSVTSSYAACHTYPADGGHTAALVTMDGTQLATSDRTCIGDLTAVMGDKLVWVTPKAPACKPDRLSIITRSGAHKVATGTYDDDPVAALGGVVVGAHAGSRLADQTYTDKQLVLVTSARKHRVLVTAH